MSLVLNAAIAVCVAGSLAVPAVAAPSSAQTAADRAAVQRAVSQYATAQAKAADTEKRLSETSAELDRLVAKESAARDRLRSRALAMYRSGDIGLLSVLLSASSFQDFVLRWDFLARIASQDAASIAQIKTARLEAERSAQELLKLQADQAKAVDALSTEVARAKKELASSEAALREYEARTAARQSAKPAPPAASDSTQQLSGTGAWQTAVASHYGRNFSGRSASGEKIGPYSMIVAHKTLPFGTLLEFEYNGKRAVARVVDRGPFTPGRTFDLGPGVVRVLGFSGVHEVRYRIISR